MRRSWLLLPWLAGCPGLEYDEDPAPEVPVPGLADLCEPAITCGEADDALTVVVGADDEVRSAQAWVVEPGGAGEVHTLAQQEAASCGAVAWSRVLARGASYVADVDTTLGCDAGVVIVAFDARGHLVGCTVAGVDLAEVDGREDAPWWLAPARGICTAP